jgi:hypothetical protein
MSIVTETYTRKPFEIDAVRITNENMEDVAEWCGGVIQETDSGKRYIKVDVIRPLNDKQTRGFAGDWALKVKTSFKLYTHKAFMHCFDKGSIETNYHPDQPTLFDTDGVLEAPKPVIMPKGYPEPSTR